MERSAGNNVVTENLGQQSVEGVNATGSRSTTTIPAGAIGNLQPIKIVAEQWGNGFDDIKEELTYLSIRPDPDHVLPAGYVHPALRK